jgi:hypothetical protein
VFEILLCCFAQGRESLSKCLPILGTHMPLSKKLNPSSSPHFSTPIDKHRHLQGVSMRLSRRLCGGV